MEKRTTNRKGKTYEELYGPEKARQLKKNLSKIFSKKYVGENNPFFGKTHTKETLEIFRNNKLGKTYEEMYGVERAESIKNKIRKEVKPRNYHTEYDEKFFCVETRQSILKEQNYLCGLCLDALGYRFKKNLHHINYIKKDNRRRNLIYLCVTCHTMTNFNREFWKGYLRGLNRRITKEKKLSRKTLYKENKKLEIKEKNMLFNKRRKQKWLREVKGMEGKRQKRGKGVLKKLRKAWEGKM